MNYNFSDKNNPINKIIYYKKQLIITFLAAVLSVIFLVNVFAFAKNKYFWGDEETTIIRDCAQSYKSLLIDGAKSEITSAPLYFIMNKFVISDIHNFNKNILIYYRLVSIFFGLLTLLIFFIFLSKYLGITSSFIAVFTLICNESFFYYAAECRPYMSWLFFIVILILYSAYINIEIKFEIKKRHLIFYSLICFLFCLSVKPAIAHIFTALFTCMICWILLFQKKDRKVVLKFLFVTAIITFITGMYYAAVSHVTKVDAGYGLDILHDKGRLHLLRRVIDTFFNTYYSRISDIQNILVIIGIGFFFYFAYMIIFRKSNDFVVNNKSIGILSTHTFAQLLLTIPLGLIVAFSHYFFISRAFIYLIVCRAIFVGIGSFFIIQYIDRNFNKWKNIIKVLIILFLTINLYSSFKNFIVDLRYERSTINNSPIKQNPIKLSQKMYCYIEKGKEYDIISTNSIVYFDIERKRNKIERSNSEIGYVTFIDKPNSGQWYLISSTIPENAVPITQAGRPVILDIKFKN